jgi:hypothetical protein
MVVWKHRSSERLQSEADQLLERGDFKGAALIWKHLVERHPGDAQALQLVAIGGRGARRLIYLASCFGGIKSIRN